MTVVIVGISNDIKVARRLYSRDDDNESLVKQVSSINAYLVAGENVIVEKRLLLNDDRSPVEAGGNLLISSSEAHPILQQHPTANKFINRAYGSSEYIRGDVRYCIWVVVEDISEAAKTADFAQRFSLVATLRRKSPKRATQKGADWPHRFEEVKQSGNERVIIVPKVSSEGREYLPVGLLTAGSIITDLAFALYDAPLWNMALIASRLHLVWIATVCGKLKTDFRYSNTLGWNTFPIPTLTISSLPMNITSPPRSPICTTPIAWTASFRWLGKPTIATTKC